MALVLALLASGRPGGFTASVLDAAIRGAETVPGVEVRRIRLHSHRFGPCTSCFQCIRDDPHECVLPDAMGTGGALMAQLRSANGWILADPVHFWGPSAQAHLFIERCYPFVWSGGLAGMPFAAISCASNQGMHRLANQELCKWAFTLGLRYIEGLAVHTAGIEQALRDAGALGRQLAEAAVTDARSREPFPERERYVAYLEAPWSPLGPYLDNLTNGTLAVDTSLLSQALETFRRPDAVALLEQAREPLCRALELEAAGERAEAARHIVQAGALWTHATWKEFLEEDVIRAEAPAAYRPLEA